MSKTHLSARALAALVLLPLAAAVACAKRANTEPPRPSGAEPLNAEGKSIEEMFAGKFPGVTVTSGPNGGLQIRMRGAGSFYGNDEPLYILDETPLPAGTGGVVFVNPYDIQRIEALKNPADIAIYGIRGANGVIKITTKRPSRRVSPE